MSKIKKNAKIFKNCYKCQKFEKITHSRDSAVVAQ